MKSTKLLIKDLQHEYWKTRAIAARKLGEIGDPVVVFPLIEVLRDEEKSVRKSAVEALGKIGGPAVMPLINVVFEDHNWKIRSEAADALLNYLGMKTVIWPNISNVLWQISENQRLSR